MNEKVKSFFTGFVTAVISIGTFIFGIFIHHNRKSDDGVKPDLRELSDSTERLSDSTDDLSERNKEFGSTTKRFAELLQQIEKQKY